MAIVEEGRTPMNQMMPKRLDTMLDLAAYPLEHRIERASVLNGEAVLDWSDGRQSRFHAIWLRDNCACPVCRHPQALERRYILIDDGEARLASVEVGATGDLLVRFASTPAGAGHESRFDAGWLRHHCYQDWAHAERRQPIRLWGSELESEIIVVEYGAFMGSDRALAGWIAALMRDGIVLLSGAPSREGEIQRIAERVGPIRDSNFGPIFDVVSRPNPNASAYTPMGLELHTDLANWDHPPGVQLLFCLANDAVGGESIYGDGFKVAEDLRREEPQVFQRLASQMFDFRFHDESCDLRARGPVIQLGPDGTVERVRFNNWLRAPFDIAENEVEPTYEALRLFWSRLRVRRNQIRLKLNAGQMIAVANARVMHGREPFDPNTGFRHMQGCLMDMDWVRNRLRLLERA
jgi:gamma-butyrobetaine hydroxylase